MKIAICLTTFLRDDLLKETIQSITNHNTNNHLILIGDQNPSLEKEHYYSGLPNCTYRPQGYDIGLSAARNDLVKEAFRLKYTEVLIIADSIQFNEEYDFAPAITIMRLNKIARIGFSLFNRCKWEFNLNLISGKYFELILPQSNTIHFINDLNTCDYEFKKVDICKNFFLADTVSLLKCPWDENLKLMEHEDFCWRYKQKGYKTYVTDYISANYIDSKPPKYKVMRDRMYKEFQQKLKEKYHIQRWINYGPGVMDAIRKEKNK